MWRWPTVAGQKEAWAKAKGKIYGMHSKLIAIAAEKWADPSINGSLADAITSAKRAWVTSDVIDRAVKRGAGLDKESARVEEIFYEWYAPGGVAIIVRTLTDNRNRTAPSMRHIFSAFWWNLGESGSVSGFAFEYKGKIVVEEPPSREELELAIMETPAEDYEMSDTITIYTKREELMHTKWMLEKSGYTILEASMGYSAKNFTPVTEFDHALKLYSMLEAFDEDEDVEIVWNTADISEELWKEVEEHVAARRFRT
jgi:YebC/PmpR family DNA-binding regulatory protein